MQRAAGRQLLVAQLEYGPIFDPLRPDLKERLGRQRRVFGWTSHATSLHEALK
jgi:hypothetical protein